MIIGSGLYSLIISAYALYHQKTVVKDLKKINWPIAFAIAGFVFLSMFYSIILFYRLLRDYDVHKVCALTYVSPLFTLAIAFFFMGEKVTLLSAIGVVLVVSGVVCLSYKS